MTAAPAPPLAGAKLLPASVPLRFFLAASLFHALAWAVLAVSGSEAAGFLGGAGTPLAALHLVTLGVLATVVMGATFQLMPVATRLPVGPVWPAGLIFLLHVSGVAVLVSGMAMRSPRFMAIGAIVCTAGLVAFALASVWVLRRATKMSLLVVHLWCAFGALATLTILAAALVFNYEHGFLGDPGKVALAHMSAAIYGFMGLLALGLSHVLLPMFALAPAPPPQQGSTVLGLAGIALGLGMAGVVVPEPTVLAAGLLVGLLAAGAHVAAIESSLRRRMRKRLGTPFLLVRVGHGCLLLNLALGLLLAIDVPVRNGGGLFVWLAVAGWLLTFMLGILQKIIPFLASMHLAQTGASRVAAAELGPRWALMVHTVCHLLALVLVTAGFALDAPLPIRLGAGLGVAGAVAFGWFAVSVASLVFRHPARTGLPVQAPSARS